MGALAIAATETGLRAIDVSDASAPLVLGAMGTWDTAFRLTIADGIAYVAALNAGLERVRLSDPTHPRELAVLADLGDTLRVSVAGDLAYVADTDGHRVRVVDVSNPETPVELGSVSTGGEPCQMEVMDDVAYVTTSSRLLILDVSDPSLPVEIGALDGEPCGLAVAGQIVYVADALAGLRVIDASNPAAPVQVGVLATTGEARDVAVAGSVAYVADGFSGLRIIDVSDPSAPVEVGIVDTPDDAIAVAVAGDFAYVADGASLRVIDVSNPSAPRQVGALVPLSPFGLLADVVVVDAVALMADEDSGVWVVDVTRPEAPVEIGLLPTPPGGVTGLDAANGLVYAASVSSGLLLFDPGPELRRISIAIDVKPGSDGNRIDPRGSGPIRVAVLGSERFDVSQIDRASLALGPSGAATVRRIHVRDANRDGVPDLVARFCKRQTGIARGDTEACLTGQLLDGTRFEGCDAIRTPEPR